MAKNRANGRQNGQSEALNRSIVALRAQGVPFAKVADLAPWADNPRLNAAAIPVVVASMQRFGWTNPILVRAADGFVEAGHTRLAAAVHLKLDEVPVIRLEHTEDDAKLYALADNRTAEVAEWDVQVLHRVLGNFDADDILVAGWNRADLDAVAEAAGAFAEGDFEDAFGRMPHDRPDARQVTFVLSVEDLGVMHAAFERLSAECGQALRGSALKSWALMELVKRHG